MNLLDPLGGEPEEEGVIMELIASNLRIPGAATNGFDLPGPARGGGSKCKVVQYFVEIIGALNTPTVKVDIMHSPTGVLFSLHTGGLTPMASTTIPVVGAFDSNPAAILGEYIRPRFVTNLTATDWLLVNVYEMRKPY